MGKEKQIKKLKKELQTLKERIIKLENSTRNQIRNICLHTQKKIVFIKDRNSAYSDYIYDRYELICDNCGMTIDTIRLYDSEDYYSKINPKKYSEKLGKWIAEYGTIDMKCEKRKKKY